MSVSNSFNFTLNRNALIKRALLLLGVVSADQTPTSAEIDDASEMLNLMLKAWQADGLQLWTVTQVALNPIQGQYKYTFGHGGDIQVVGQPVEVFEAYRHTAATTVDVPLIRLARTDYWELSDKDTEGTPTQFYFDPQITGSLSNFYIWPAPSSSFASGSDYSIEILYQKPFDDMDSASDTLAFPQYWELSVVYGLAALLAPEYGHPTTDRRTLWKEAESIKEKAIAWDTEHVSMFLTPEPTFNG